MTGIVKYQAGGKDIELSLKIVRECLCNNAKGASDEEINRFITLCKFQGINPFLNEAYLVKYGNQETSIIPSKELFLKRAETHPQYNGCENGIIVLRNGKCEYIEGTFSLPTDQIVGGWARVYRKDQAKPCFKAVSFNEYCQKKSDGTPNKFWREKPGTMIAKVAIAQALRESFPNVLGGLYMEEEQGQKVVDTTAEVISTTVPTQKPVQTIEVAAEVDDCPYKTIEDAKTRLVQIVGSNLFDDEEKAEIKKNWTVDWRKTIVDAETMFELKNNAMKQSQATFQE